MNGFNWIDIIILLLLIVAIVESVRVGLLTQLFVIVGFFGTLFFCGWLFPHLLPIHDRTLRTLVNANLVLIVSIYAGIRGFDLAQNIHWSLRKGKRSNKNILGVLEAWLGALPGITAYFITVWLLAVMVGRLPFAGFSNSANDALIVQTLTRALPPVPAVFAEFNRQVDPNSQPYLFAQPKPQASFEYSASGVQAATAQAMASVVRITSFGCGGIVAASGFVAGPNLVATNAHVIAGVERPIIKYNNRSYVGVPVLFDTGLDFALLRVSNLAARPLVLARENIPVGASVAVLGYPGGNYTVSPGIIRNDLDVFGRNIYDVGLIGRDVYEVQTTVDHGSSGGPIVLSDGRVAGVLFSKSDDLPDYAYALASSHLLDELAKAEKSYRRVSTGACLAS